MQTCLDSIFQIEAEAQGLQRLNGEDLKAFIPGSLTYTKPDGEKHTNIETGWQFRAQVLQRLQRNLALRCLKKCLVLQSTKNKGTEKACFAVFRAPNENSYFDYDIENGLYAHTFAPANAE